MTKIPATFWQRSSSPQHASKAAAGSNDHSVTVKKICKARLGFMQSLKIWKTFGKGWSRRVADIEVKGVAMALAYMGATDSRIKADAKAGGDEGEDYGRDG